MSLTLGSLFDGAGTIPFAAQLCGITPIWSSEIEKFPCAVTAKRFPNMKQLGDITKINGREIEPVDIIAGGSPCFPAGTMVLSKNGYVPIETLKVGDEVCTHLGNWKPIEAVGNKEAETLRVSGGHYGIICTPNHPFYAKKEEYIHPHRGSVIRNLSEPKWVEAKDMRGHRFAAIKTISPIDIPQMVQTENCKPPLPISEDLMYIVGRWLGDGWVRDNHRKGRGINSTQHQIFICCNQKKREVLAQRLHILLDGICKVATFEERTVIKFRFSHKGMCEWLVKNFGKYAGGKTIPAWVFGLKPSLIRALFCGYIDSDGHAEKNGDIKATTVSKSLAVGMRTIGEILGYQCGLYFFERPRTAVIEGRTVNQQNTYTLHFRNTKVKSVIMERDYNWYKCRKVVPTNKTETVYNITVADDHSYVVEGYAVHNCQNLSVAGNREGLAGEQSGLFMEQIRVIKEMRDETSKRTNEPVRPRYAVWENVFGAFSSNKGEDFRVVLEEFCKVKDEGAYVPKPSGGGGSLAGASWETGIPWLGASSMLNFGECPNVVEESGLWQILEENVPQKYFLSETACLGVLRRAERRGKELKPILKLALEQQIERWRKYGSPLPVFEGECVIAECYDARGNGGGEVVPTITGDHNGHMSDYTAIVCFSQDAYDKYEETEHGATLRASGGIYGGGSENLVCKPVYCLQGNGIDRADTAGCNGKGVAENVSYTLNTVDRHAVCCEAEGHTHDFLVRMREGKDGGGKGALGQEDKSGTIACNNDQVLFQKAETQYIVRRLTPLECCRLQGMPGFWTDGVEGSDAARYKLWGNGMALPNALYVMEGIAEVENGC